MFRILFLLLSVAWATAVFAQPAPSPDSVDGTGLDSVDGTGLETVEGTGMQGGSSGTETVEGTGLQSASGTESVDGTGMQLLGSAEATRTATRSYTVVSGDTLGRISTKMYGDSGSWQRIYDANRDSIADPNHLSVGMVLAIPR